MDMPLYSFHLKLELYPSPVRKSRDRYGSTSSVDVPPRGSDIFSAFPTHRRLSWSRLSPSQTLQEPLKKAAHNSNLDETFGSALLLPERSSNLRISAPLSSNRSQSIKISNETAASDWRYDLITIDSIEMDLQEKKASDETPNRKSAAGGLHTKALYIPGDIKSTDIGWGVIHLYRDTEESMSLRDSSILRSHGDGHAHGNSHIEDCDTLCILAVPSWMMPSDLLGFLGDQARADVSHFRLLRTERANKYMVLMKFRSYKKASEWYHINNGRLFSAAEPENCHVVFIKSVEFVTSGKEEGDEIKFPNNMADPFVSKNQSQALSSRPQAPPPPNLLELPTCPVCLERMDETTGLLTILCQHVFHCACLEKWRGSGCPVCRYTHSPSFTFPYPRPGSEVESPEPLCSICASTANLWICLICGNIGCGRYDSAHAYAHYEATSHCYAMDIETQHVWDYAGDGYVHRLIQNKPEVNKPSESSSNQRTRHENEAFSVQANDSVPREKMESMAAEYTYLLTSQLEGQRRYFEEQVQRAVDKAFQASSRAEDAFAQSTTSVASLQKMTDENYRLSESLTRAEKALEKTEKARVRFEQLARDLTGQLREEKTISEGLSKRISIAEDKAKQAQKSASEMEKQKAELEEMNRDLTMFISAQEKVKELQDRGEDVAQGDISLPPEQRKKKGKGKKR